MEQNKENNGSLIKLFTSTQPLKKKMMTQLLLSVSLFSFVFSYYSLSSNMPQFLFHPRKLQYYSLFHLPIHAMINKNFIFLICNGLLVFLSKTSGMFTTSNSSGYDMLLQKMLGDALLTPHNGAVDQTKQPFSKEEVHVETREEEGMERETKEVSIFIADSDHEDRGAASGSDFEGEINGICSEFDDDEYLSREEEDEVLSTEELNRKFEEFIRKMKEEIMVNESGQLVTVKQ